MSALTLQRTSSVVESGVPPVIGRTIATVRSTFLRWLRTAETRRQLQRLDDRMLRDIGFDPQEAQREAARPFWRGFTLSHCSKS